ncbi:unnamed protein product, partial [marine sediment metagenome]
MRIITLNLNGIRASLKKGLLDFIKKSDADILCFQETKAQPGQIDEEPLEKMGYTLHWHSAEKKGYSGVAILTRIKPDNVIIGCGIDDYDREGRLIRADFGELSVISAYFPSGTTGTIRQDFKYNFLDDIYEWTHEVSKKRQKLVLSGDYNICHRAIDIHNPKSNKNSSGFLPEEREWMEKFFTSGFSDSFRLINEDPHNYSWWSYRANSRGQNKGWRIDYNAVSDNL